MTPKPLTYDPRWKETSASLREGVLFVKMPVSQAFMLILVLQSLLKQYDPNLAGKGNRYLKEDFLDFLIKEVEGARALGHYSVFYQVPEEAARKDSALLLSLAGTDTFGILSHFQQVLEAGLREDPEVDWIARVGGPSPNANLLSLDEPMDLDLEEVSDDPLQS